MSLSHSLRHLRLVPAIAVLTAGPPVLALPTDPSAVLGSHPDGREVTVAQLQSTRDPFQPLDLRSFVFRQGTDLKGADLGCTDLSGAEFHNLDLMETAFTGATLDGAEFSGCIIDSAAVQAGVFPTAIIQGAIQAARLGPGKPSSGAGFADEDSDDAMGVPVPPARNASPAPRQAGTKRKASEESMAGEPKVRRLGLRPRARKASSSAAGAGTATAARPAMMPQGPSSSTPAQAPSSAAAATPPRTARAQVPAFGSPGPASPGSFDAPASPFYFYGFPSPGFSSPAAPPFSGGFSSPAPAAGALDFLARLIELNEIREGLMDRLGRLRAPLPGWGGLALKECEEAHQEAKVAMVQGSGALGAPSIHDLRRADMARFRFENRLETLKSFVAQAEGDPDPRMALPVIPGFIQELLALAFPAGAGSGAGAPVAAVQAASSAASSSSGSALNLPH
jgi:hypothetical protein